MSEKGKIIKSTHIANFSENGIELTEDGILFFEQLRMESIGNDCGKFPPTPFDPISLMLRWGSPIQTDSTKKLETDPRC